MSGRNTCTHAHHIVAEPRFVQKKTQTNTTVAAHSFAFKCSSSSVYCCCCCSCSCCCCVCQLLGQVMRVTCIEPHSASPCIRIVTDWEKMRLPLNRTFAEEVTSAFCFWLQSCTDSIPMNCIFIFLFFPPLSAQRSRFKSSRRFLNDSIAIWAIFLVIDLQNAIAVPLTGSSERRCI